MIKEKLHQVSNLPCQVRILTKDLYCTNRLHMAYFMLIYISDDDGDIDMMMVMTCHGECSESEVDEDSEEDTDDGDVNGDFDEERLNA